jgi:PPK2 family polyphosphate:nucleotide phosphotransferase
MRSDPIDPKARIRLTDHEARPPKGAPSGKRAKELAKRESKRIARLQKVLYASSGRSLLVILQGRDASGKDGAIRHVFRPVDPQGLQVASFEPPTPLEQAHDFLWRVHQRVPPRGMIGIFNRSHYEEVLVPRVHGDISRRSWKERYEQINDFERLLVKNDTVILKFFLHISRAEQRERFEKRIADPEKNWKFHEGDLDDRALWARYTAAYRDVFRACNSPWAPWYFVPADDKPFRNWFIARTIADALTRMHLRYPRVSPAIRRLKIE